MRPAKRIIIAAAFVFLAVFTSLPHTVEGALVKVLTPDEVLALFPTKVRPIYPYEARRARATGTGIFRMYINPDGTVRTVGVMKSTGNKDLDLAAAAGLYRWKAIRGKRREVDMPVTFTMGR